MSLVPVPVSSAFGQSVMDDFDAFILKWRFCSGAINQPPSLEARKEALIFNSKLGKGRTSCFNLPTKVGREK
jgi:hypothetical protein